MNNFSPPSCLKYRRMCVHNLTTAGYKGATKVTKLPGKVTKVPHFARQGYKGATLRLQNSLSLSLPRYHTINLHPPIHYHNHHHIRHVHERRTIGSFHEHALRKATNKNNDKKYYCRKIVIARRICFCNILRVILS